MSLVRCRLDSWCILEETIVMAEKPLTILKNGLDIMINPNQFLLLKLYK